jgi:hypothetical protein
VSPSASEVAAICQVSITTAKRWLAHKSRIPDYALLRLSGDLGAVNDAWKGWRIEGDSLISPKGWIIGRRELESVPGLREQLADVQQELAAVRSNNLVEDQPLPD